MAGAREIQSQGTPLRLRNVCAVSTCQCAPMASRAASLFLAQDRRPRASFKARAVSLKIELKRPRAL